MTSAQHWSPGVGNLFPGSAMPGISNTQKYSYGDMRSGVQGLQQGTGNPKQAYADELAPFFGRVQVYDPPNPYDSFESENYDLPAAFKGNNSFLRRIMIEKITNAECYPTIELMPWTKSPYMQFQWEEWHFGRHMLSRTPDESVSRLVTSSFTSNKESMHRWGLGLKLEHGFYKTDMGRTCYAMNLMQIQIAVIETFNHNVMHMLYNVKPYRNRFAASGMDKVELEHAFNQEKRYWGIIHKERNAFNVIERYAALEMEDRVGERGNHITVPAGSFAAILERPEASMYIYDGPLNKEPLGGGKVQVRESRGFTISGTKARTDPAFNNRVIGGYFYLTLSHLDDHDLEQFNIGMMDSLIWDEGLDDFYRFSFRDNFGKAGLFDNWNTAQQHLTNGNKQQPSFVTNDTLWMDSLFNPQPSPINSMPGIAHPVKNATWSQLGENWLRQVLHPEIRSLATQQANNSARLGTFNECYADTTWGDFYAKTNKLTPLSRQLMRRSLSDPAAVNNMLTSIPHGNALRLFTLMTEQLNLKPGNKDLFNSSKVRVDHTDALWATYSNADMDNLRGTQNVHVLTHPTDAAASHPLNILFDLCYNALYNTRNESHTASLITFLKSLYPSPTQQQQVAIDNIAAGSPDEVFREAVIAAFLLYQGPNGFDAARFHNEWDSLVLPAQQQKLYDGMFQIIMPFMTQIAVTWIDTQTLDNYTPGAQLTYAAQANVDWNAQYTTLIDSLRAIGKPIDVASVNYSAGEEIKESHWREILTRHTPITDVSFFKAVIDHDFYPCIGLICFRPYQRWRMGSALYTFSGGRVGATYYKDPDFLLGDNIEQKLHLGHFTMYGKAIIMKPNYVMTIDDIIGQRYLGGWGHTTWDASSPKDKDLHTNDYMKNDMYICAVPIDFTPEDSYTDITGSTHECLKHGAVSEKARTEGTWGGCRAYAAYWGWYQNRTAVDSVDGRLNTQKRFNTLCFQDHQTLYCRGKFAGNYRVNKGHWGERLYPGCAIKHTTAGVYLEPVNYKSTATVTIGV